MCDSKCIRFNFDQGINFDFKCPECGELMIQENNDLTIKKLEKEVLFLDKEIKKRS